MVVSSDTFGARLSLTVTGDSGRDIGLFLPSDFKLSSRDGGFNTLLSASTSIVTYKTRDK